MILGGATTEDHLGPFFGATLSAAEVRYLMTHEWAMSSHDILWRRSKLGLRLKADEVQSLDAFIASEQQNSLPDTITPNVNGVLPHKAP